MLSGIISSSLHAGPLAVTAAASECCTQRGVLVREIKDVLRQACGLDDAPDLDGSFFLDELTDGQQEVRREL